MAAAAERACHLTRIYFVPAPNPWHRDPPRAAYADRYAMVALAVAARTRWQPLAVPDAPRRPTYALDQLQWMADWSSSQGRRERLYWIVGADAFVTLPTWHDYRRLLQRCDFVVMGRDGYSLDEVVQAVPREVVKKVEGKRVQLAGGRELHWLPQFSSPVSATRARAWLAASKRRNGRSVVPVEVARYARRAGLYEHGQEN